MHHICRWAIRFSLASGLVLAQPEPPLPASDYHVAPSGSDANPGTADAPFRTVQKACDSARAGDRILLAEGVYAEENVFLRYSGAEDRPIVLRNRPGERPVIEGRIELHSHAGWQRPIGWITIEGLEIRNGWDGIKFYNAQNVLLRHNNIHHARNQGILGNGYQVRIEGNVIAHNGFKPDNEQSTLEHGIYCTGTHFTIINNVIHSNTGYGIQVAGYAYEPAIHAAPEFAGARHWLISHNTIAFHQNRAAIVVWQSDATDCVIQNNILYHNAVKLGAGATNGVDFVSGGGHVVRNNILFAPGKLALNDASGASYRAYDNVHNDPRFVSPAEFDFRLQHGSPAIDAGTLDEPIETDIEGTRRPQGQRPDIGAYECRP